MTLPKKSRSITVNDIHYKWMTSRASGILSVPVLIQEAAGQGPILKLVFWVETQWAKSTGDDATYRLVQVTSITPAIIRKAILEAIEFGWSPTERSDLQFRIDFDGRVRVINETAGERQGPNPIDDDESWDHGDPLAALTYYLIEYRRPHPSWVKKWSAGGDDPVYAAWQATSNPAIMMDVLLATGQCDSLTRILHAFAFQTGKVGELLQLESLGFPPRTGWPRHLDGTNERLSEQDKLRSIREDIALLSKCARERADIREFRITMIETTDIGTHGHWGTFLKVTADLLRSIIPIPPTLEMVERKW